MAILQLGMQKINYPTDEFLYLLFNYLLYSFIRSPWRTNLKLVMKSHEYDYVYNNITFVLCIEEKTCILKFKIILMLYIVLTIWFVVTGKFIWGNHPEYYRFSLHRSTLLSRLFVCKLPFCLNKETIAI